MRYLLLLLFLLCSSTYLWGKRTIIPSCDSIEIYLTRFKEERLSFPTNANFYIRRSLLLAQNCSNFKSVMGQSDRRNSIVYLTNQIAVSFTDMGSYDSALTYSNKAQKLAETLNLDIVNTFKLYNTKGKIYKELYKAKDNLFWGKEKFDNKKNLDSARYWYSRANKSSVSNVCTSDTLLLFKAFIWNNLGEVCNLEEKLDSAIICYRKALSIAKGISNNKKDTMYLLINKYRILGWAYDNLAMVYLKKYTKERKLEYFNLNMSRKEPFSPTTLNNTTLDSCHHYLVWAINSRKMVGFITKNKIKDLVELNMSYYNKLEYLQILATNFPTDSLKSHDSLLFYYNEYQKIVAEIGITTTNNATAFRNRVTIIQQESKSIEDKGFYALLFICFVLTILGLFTLTQWVSQNEALKQKNNSIEKFKSLSSQGSKLSVNIYNQTLQDLVNDTYDSVKMLLGDTEDIATLIATYNPLTQNLRCKAKEGKNTNENRLNIITDKEHPIVVCFNGVEESPYVIDNMDDYRAKHLTVKPVGIPSKSNIYFQLKLPTPSITFFDDESETMQEIKQADTVIGVFSVQYFKPKTFNPEEKALLEGLATFLAIAIDNVKKIENKNQSLKEAYAAADFRYYAATHDVRKSLPMLYQNMLDCKDDNTKLDTFENVRDGLAQLVTTNELIDSMQPKIPSEFSVKNEAFYLHELMLQYEVARSSGNNITVHNNLEKGSEDPKQRIKVRGDKSFVIYILKQLIDNAIKFSPKFGKIEISAEIEGKMVKVRVRDQGNGISEEAKQRLFRWDIDPRTEAEKAAGKGMGMGLTLCNRIIDSFNKTINDKYEKPESEIGVENNTNQQGTTFFFTLILIEE